MRERLPVRAARAVRRHALPIGLVLAAGTFLALVRPFGSEARWPGAWFYWTALIAVGTIAGLTINAGWARIAPTLGQRAQLILTPILIAAVITAVLWATYTLTTGGFPLRTLFVTYGYALVISVAMTALFSLADRTSQAPEGSDSREDAPSSALLDRLPPRLRGAPLIAIAAEDHYLRVYTERGDALVLMRLSDAVRALAAHDGMQVHRSWWVARAAIRDAVRSNGRVTLTLTNGVAAPVSRTYAPRLRQAGWV